MAISTRLDASSGKMSSLTVDQRQDAILSIFRATVFGTRIHRYILYIVPDIDTIIVCIIMISYPLSYTISYILLDDIKLMLLLVQDCVCVVAPYPFRIEPLEDFDPIGDLDVTGGGDLWYARPLLFFTCTVCPTGHMGDGTSHKDVSLVFFSTFEPISLTPDSCMQRKGVPMLYERAASQGPSLYVCPVENVLGRVPLIPCYLNGNSVNSIPHCFRDKIPREASADSRPDSGTGSRLFEVNMWMWRYGRTFPRQISVDQAVEFLKKRVQESRARGAETLRRRRDAAWVKGASAPQ